MFENRMGGGHSNTILGYFAMMIVIVVTLSSSGLYLPKQSFWVDEVTQMSGLTLNPIEVVSWLTGENSGRFGVPPDRMPPLSYWLGWSWSQVFGLTETSLRWLGASVNLIAVGILFITLYKNWGLLSALLLGMAFALSPNIVANSVEIRAYPLFLLFSCGSFFFFIEILKRNEIIRPVIGLALCLILAMYTHFYGVVLAAVLFSVLLLVTWQIHEKLKPILFAGGLTSIATIGLIPFVLASISISNSPSITEGTRFYLRDTIRLGYRLIGHPTMTNQIIVIIVLISIATLLIISLKIGNKNSQINKGLWLSLLLGLTVITIANFVFFKFNPTIPHYNLWMVPNFYLILASSLEIVKRGNFLNNLALTAVTLLIIANIYGTSQLITHSEYFSHGPHRQLVSTIHRLGVEKVSIIYEKSSRNWGFAYFPLHYEFNQSLSQYLYQSKVTPGIAVRKLPKDTTDIDPMSLTTPYIIVILIKQYNAQEVKQQVRVRYPIAIDGVISQTLKSSNSWQVVGRESFPGFIAAEVVIFKKDLSEFKDLQD